MDIIIRHFKYAEPDQTDPTHQRAVASTTDGCSLHRTGGFVAEAGPATQPLFGPQKHGHSVVGEIGLVQRRSASPSSDPVLAGWWRSGIRRAILTGSPTQKGIPITKTPVNACDAD